MPETLSPDHPNLLQAVTRLKRIFWAWGGLFLLMGLFTAAAIQGNGMGLGVVFSPTAQRKIALSTIGVGLVVFISIFIIGRLTLL